ncbi:hypothetical protein V500_03529 [Pseudogymnoascus sp. VKM F-4518 (FW-2643)]|nr:hypothetical protein V500_03529 [Pseudogymnoascus sp. VKM F-4518 (FW-2643)]
MGLRTICRPAVSSARASVEHPKPGRNAGKADDTRRVPDVAGTTTLESGVKWLTACTPVSASYVGWIRGYAGPQFSEGASLDQHGPNQVEGVHATNVKSLRWLSPRGSAGRNEIKTV